LLPNSTKFPSKFNLCRYNWENCQPIPRVPPRDPPDVRCCLLHQQLQLLNCCIARRAAREATDAAAAAADAAALRDGGGGEQPVSPAAAAAREGSTGEAPSGILLLETGQPLHVPRCQEGAILTTDDMRETEELVMKKGSIGMGAAQLFSDMQAFKAGAVHVDSP
jgi:Rab3 GTPase-activating protein catalytic subunit